MTFSSFWSSSTGGKEAAGGSGQAKDGDAAEQKLLAQLKAKIEGDYLSEWMEKLSPNDPVLSVLKRRDTESSADYDGLLLRYLRYNSRDINKASDQLRKFLTWRVDKHVYNYTDDDLRGRQPGLPIYIHEQIGTRSTNNNSLQCALIFTSARHYVKKEVDTEAHEVGVIRVFEKIFFDLKANCALTIVDFSGVTITQCDMTRMKNDIMLFLNYYPETFRKFLFINYPKFIHGMWKIIKPILDERTSERVVWCENDKDLPNTLEAYFDPSEIPAWLGGTNTHAKLDIYCGLGNDDPAQFQQELTRKFAKNSQ